MSLQFQSRRLYTAGKGGHVPRPTAAGQAGIELAVMSSEQGEVLTAVDCLTFVNNNNNNTRRVCLPVPDVCP